MTLITAEQMNMSLTQAEIDDHVNQFILPEVEFAQVCSLYHRFFGVWTDAKDGEILYTDDMTRENRTTAQTKDRYLLTPCVRYQYPRLIDGLQAELENWVGYTLTPRYIVEEVPFTSPTYQYQANFGGIEVVNVRQVWYPIEGLEEIAVNYCLQIDLTIEAYSMSDSAKVALIEQKLFTNPNEVFLREYETMVYYPWFTDNDHPLRRSDNPNWRLPLAENIRTYDPLKPLGGQHKKYVFIDIDAPDLPAGAELYPVYPDSHQKIHEARPRQVLDNGKIRFWFYIYTLVHPDYCAENIDLIGNDFYKLYPFISFKYAIEEEYAPQIVVTQGEDITTLLPTATLVSSEYGLINLTYDTCQAAWDALCSCSVWPKSVWVRYGYKTNPRLLSYDQQNYIVRLKEALSRRVAAELPLTACGCEIPPGWLRENQTNYNTRYVIGQAVADTVRYGQLHGQLAYAEILNNAPVRTRMIEATTPGRSRPTSFLSEF